VHTLFVLILLTYAVLGMHLFRHVNWKHDTHANFCSLWGAVLTMYRCTTGEGWNELMHIAMRPSADCDPQHLREGSCGSWVAIPFFISYVFFTAFVVLKMVVALIIQHYTFSIKQEFSRVQAWHTEAFVRAWSEVDPDAMGQIPLSRVSDVVLQLPPPLGLDPKLFRGATIRKSDVSNFISQQLGHGGRNSELKAIHSPRFDEPVVLFHDLHFALLNSAFGDAVGNVGKEHDVIKKMSALMKDQIHIENQQLLGRKFDADDQCSVAENYAATIVQRRWRGKRARISLSRAVKELRRSELSA